ncbi:hypothetical protein L210DRAFT_3509216 [Boletus edulis BED1]|uniref:Uncharacterized protein n=1 Tax=Boletus edulis BED1 TaxID=1328754 RepID=A0AAD4G7K8_BOLED|nr:hypothetical protein L210DRAFT_3509216 [Boletus edulis BED1]
MVPTAEKLPRESVHPPRGGATAVPSCGWDFSVRSYACFFPSRPRAAPPDCGPCSRKTPAGEWTPTQGRDDCCPVMGVGLLPGQGRPRRTAVPAENLPQEGVHPPRGGTTTALLWEWDYSAKGGPAGLRSLQQKLSQESQAKGGPAGLWSLQQKTPAGECTPTQGRDDCCPFTGMGLFCKRLRPPGGGTLANLENLASSSKLGDKRLLYTQEVGGNVVRDQP